MNKIISIHDILFKIYGPQRWWPTTLEGELHPSYHGKKHNEKQQFEIIIGAILTQNTSWKNVEKAIFNLNKNKLLSIDKIKSISVDKLAEHIRPAGYYNQKADRLKIIAEYFSKHPLNNIFSLNVSQIREQLLVIKGIGPETADSIILYAANKPIFVIDAYTKRIFSRIGLCKKDVKYDELQPLITSTLPKKTKLFNEYHALLVELAKNHCKTKPICADCPLESICKKKI